MMSCNLTAKSFCKEHVPGFSDLLAVSGDTHVVF